MPPRPAPPSLSTALADGWRAAIPPVRAIEEDVRLLEELARGPGVPARG